MFKHGGPMKVKSLIQGKNAIVISPQASLQDLVVSLRDNRVGALVVSEDGKRVSGIISERDVVRALPDHLVNLHTFHVRDLMTAVVQTCTAETSVSELMAMMTHNRIRHVPVVDENGDLLSIVSIGDVVKSHIGELDDERQALRNYVSS
jgi:CBS domain-containing protein